MRSPPDGRHDADLQQALLDPVAAVARIARDEQRLVGLEPMRPRGRKQRRGEIGRQHAEQIVGNGWFRHAVAPLRGRDDSAWAAVRRTPRKRMAGQKANGPPGSPRTGR